MARINFDHGDHNHRLDVSFLQPNSTGDLIHQEQQALQIGNDGFMDAHELSHANDIRKRFANQNVTTWQIVLFGLTGGLIPCPAAVTVLLLCLQLKEISLGAILVLSFSTGLAITLVSVGTVTAIGVSKATGRFPLLNKIGQKAPYFASGLIVVVGLYMGYHGVAGIMNPQHSDEYEASLSIGARDSLLRPARPQSSTDAPCAPQAAVYCPLKPHS
jgi:nickel/cobalt exporter